MNERRAGTILAFITMALRTVISLAITPFLVLKLGKADYGVFTMIGSVVSNLSIFDLGLSDTVVRYVAKYRANGDREGEERFMGIVSALYGGVGLLLVLASGILWLFLPALFGHTLNAEQMESARAMLLILGASTAIAFAANGYSSTLVAYEKFTVLNVMAITAVLVSNAGIVAVLLFGMKSVAVVSVTAVIGSVTVLAKVIYAVQNLKVRSSFKGIEWPAAKEILSFSTAILVVVVVEQIYWKLDAVILGIMVGPGAVAVYSVGLTFARYFSGYSLAFSRVLMPTIVREVEQGASPESLTSSLVAISRYQAILYLPLAAALVVFGWDFIMLWMGPGFYRAYYVMLATILPLTFELIGSVRNQLMQAKGIYWQRSWVSLLIALLNIGLTVILIRSMGMPGAALSTGLGLIAGYLWVNRVIGKELGINIIRYLREVASGLIPVTIGAGLVGLLLNRIISGSWVGLAAKLGAFLLIYCGLLWIAGLRDSERSAAREMRFWKKREATA